MAKANVVSLDEHLDRIGRIGECMGEKFATWLARLWRSIVTCVAVLMFGPLCLFNGFVNGLRKR
jgi:hypothetical protein